MADWEMLLRMRQPEGRTPDETSLDTVLRRPVCPAGHFGLVTAGLSQVGWDRVEDCIDHLGRLKVDEREPDDCPHCGQRYPAASHEIQLAAWLPLARRDVLIAVSSGAPPALASWDHAGPPTPLALDDPILAEFGAASQTRSALSQLYVSQDVDRALEDLGEVQKRWPDYVPVLKGMARVHKHRGHLEETLFWVARAEEKAPTDGEIHFMRGDVLDELGQDDAAVRAYDRSIELDPSHAVAHAQRGMALRRLGRMDEAIDSYEKALEIQAHLPVALNSMAVTWFSQGELEKAAACVAQIRPHDLEGNEALAATASAMAASWGAKLSEDEKWLEAARQFDVATRLRPSDAQAWLWWAVSLYNAGAAVEAHARLRRALELDASLERGAELAEKFEKASRHFSEQGGTGGLLGLSAPHTFHYIDSVGRPATVLDFIVSVETQQQFIEVSGDEVSLESDRDLFHLLVAKGHNARVERGLEGRRMVFILEKEPRADFAALARARSWMTLGGRRIESARVPLLRSPQGPEWDAPGEDRDLFVLPRTLEGEIAHPEVFYPSEYAES